MNVRRNILPIVFTLGISYAVGQLILSFSGPSFTPMVSAIVLPVMLQTRTPLYLLSAFVFTSGILLLSVLLEHISFDSIPVRVKDAFTVTLGLPLTLSAAIATALAIILIYSYGMFIPPAGALTVLAMLVPENQLMAYLVCTAAGITLFMICAKAFFNEKPDSRGKQVI